MGQEYKQKRGENEFGGIKIVIDCKLIDSRAAASYLSALIDLGIVQ
jgi:hypothetical protein